MDINEADNGIMENEEEMVMNDSSIDDRSGDTLRAVVSQLEPRPGMQSVVHDFDLEGIGALDASFSVSVRDSVGTVVGTLNATR